MAKEFTLNTIYDAAKTSTKYRMLVGGVAFLRFGLSYTCDPDAHAAKQALPASTLPEVKVKILGFHGLSPDGDNINPISYKRTSGFKY